MVSCALKCSVRAIALTIFVIGIATSVHAQAAKPPVNSYLAKQIERLRHPGQSRPPVTRRAKFGTPYDRIMLPGLEEIMRQTANSPIPQAKAQTQMSGSSVRVPGLYSAPFTNAASPADGSEIISAVTADFDGKNGPDIVTVQTDGTLNLLTNDGKGNLSLVYTNSSAVGLNPLVFYAEAADLNKDGFPDIVAMDAENSAFLVYMNNGDGTFGNVTSISVAPASGAAFFNGGALTVADVNGDGIPDVVTVSDVQVGNTPYLSEYSTIVSQQTFLGKGDGTFSAPIGTDVTLPSYLVVIYGQALALVDFNGDKIPDLAVEICDFAQGITTISTSLGKGDGTFHPITGTGPSVTSGPGVETEATGAMLQLADLNRDGIPDAVLMTGDGNIYVSLGNSNGSLSSPTAVVQDVFYAQLFQLGDFNGDTYPDLLVFSAGNAAVYTGRGDGTFNSLPPGQYAGNLMGFQQPVPADFNGDGKLDFVWVDPSYITATFYAGLGGGTFLAAPAIIPANTSASFPNNTEIPNNIEIVATGDFNGDGITDVIAYDYTNAFIDLDGLAWPDITVGLGRGDGTFTFSLLMSGKEQFVNGYAFSVNPVTADFNHDGFPDVVMQTFNGIGVWISNGDGTFAPLKITTLPVEAVCPVNYMDFGDINNDGNLDVVIAYSGKTSACGTTNTLSGYFTLLGDGTGNFTATYTLYGTQLYQPKLADLNGDGKLDLILDDNYQDNTFLICAACPTPITILPGNGDGTFGTPITVNEVANLRINDMIPYDYDGDGKQDLTFLSDATLVTKDGVLDVVPGSQGVLLLRGNGNFTFSAPVQIASGNYVSQGGYADFNLDGKPDLIFGVRAPYQGNDELIAVSLFMMPNLGGGSFGAPVSVDPPLTSPEIFIGDFNGDGSPDVIVGGPYTYIDFLTNQVPSAIYLNQGGTKLSLSATPSSASQGGDVTLLAEVTVPPGTAAPSGTVSFSSNGAPLGNVTLSDGIASEFDTSALPAGTNVITAVYSGDQNHNPSTAAPAKVTIQAQTTAPNFTISATPQSLTIKDGQSGTVSLSLVANAAFSGQIALACSGLPAGASCAFNPPNLTLSAGQSNTISAVISTTGSSQARRAGVSPWFIGTLGGFAATQCLLLIWTRRRRNLRLILVTSVALVCLGPILALTGCGGNSSAGPPAGNSFVTLTASSSSNGVSIQQQAIVAITIAK